MPPPVTPIVSMTAPSPDPRVGLKAGRWDAGQAAWNMKMISTTPPSPKSLGATHSDLAFSGKYAIQGNYNGFEIWDISNPVKPMLVNAYVCPASQNDVSVYKNLLFMSSEATNSRIDCGFGGVPDPVSKDRVRGIRIFDIADVAHPKLVASVQTCRGSHTHTVVDTAGRQEQRLHLCLGHVGRSPGGRAARMPGWRAGRSELRALPARSDQGAARGAGDGGDHQLAAHLQRSAGAAAQRRARGGGRGGTRQSRRRSAGGGRGRSRWWCGRRAGATGAAGGGNAAGAAAGGARERPVRVAPERRRPDAATRRRPVPISATTSPCIRRSVSRGGACARSRPAARH